MVGHFAIEEDLLWSPRHDSGINLPLVLPAPGRGHQARLAPGQAYEDVRFLGTEGCRRDRMNPIASSLLVIAGSICVCGATARPASDPVGHAILLVAVGLGLWGGLSLLASQSSWRQDLHEVADIEQDGSTASLALRRPRVLAGRIRGDDLDDVDEAPRSASDLPSRARRSTRRVA